MGIDSTVFPVSMQVGNFVGWCLMEDYLNHQVYLCMHMTLNISLYCLRMIQPGKLSVSFFLSHTHFGIELYFVRFIS